MGALPWRLGRPASSPSVATALAIGGASLHFAGVYLTQREIAFAREAPHYAWAQWGRFLGVSEGPLRLRPSPQRSPFGASLHFAGVYLTQRRSIYSTGRTD